MKKLIALLALALALIAGAAAVAAIEPHPAAACDNHQC